MDYEQLLDSLSPDIVERLRRGVETGRWPDGKRLTPEQREHSLAAVIAWDQRHRCEEERIGFIDGGARVRARRDGGETPLRWTERGGEGADT
jgi:uncharacterized protein YeaC (DUF1315 family)